LRGARGFACTQSGAAVLGGFAGRFRSQDHFLRARASVMFAGKAGAGPMREGPPLSAGGT
jgi:hypothetical protein